MFMNHLLESGKVGAFFELRKGLLKAWMAMTMKRSIIEDEGLRRWKEQLLGSVDVSQVEGGWSSHLQNGLIISTYKLAYKLATAETMCYFVSIKQSYFRFLLRITSYFHFLFMIASYFQ